MFPNDQSSVINESVFNHRNAQNLIINAIQFSEYYNILYFMNKQDIKEQPKNPIKSPPKQQKAHRKERNNPFQLRNPKKISKSTKMIVPRASPQNIACVVILLLIIPASIIYTNSNWVPTAKYYAQQFDFQVYCPIYYDINYKLKQQRDETITGWIMQHLYTLADQIAIYAQLHGQQQKRIYVIQVLDQHNQTNSTNYGMRYCGLARPRTGTCQKDAKLICTNPGPIFQATKDQQIIVIWINGIKKLNPQFNKYIRNLSSCHGYTNISQQRPNFCTLKAKLPQFKHLVYEDPSITPPNDHYQNFTINDLSTPISTYMHGMAIRPSFNGGPLSWFTSKGQVGLGYSTAQRQNVDVMHSLFRRNGKMNQIISKRYKVKQYNYKIDIYSNRQPPTTLLYYDSALNVAKKNLISGLSGMYIIRDKQIQKQLPSGQYQHYILIHPSAAQSLDIYDQLRQDKGDKQYNQLNGIPQIAQSTFQDYMIFRDNVYRIRLANADFAAIYYNLRFVYKDEVDVEGGVQGSGMDKKKKDKDTKNKNKEQVKASTPTQTPTNQQKQIQFYIVATDGILREKPIGPITKLDMIAPAQRFDILITFNSSLPTKHVKLIHGKHNQQLTTIYLSNQTKSSSKMPSTIPSAIYFNFSSLDSQVVRRRMRPFHKTSDNHIATNGHLTISQGKSQDPILGSVQDWYFINNINAKESIHVDLIDFQIMDQYRLNQVPNTQRCTFYNVDFFMKYAKKCTKSIQLNNNRSIQVGQFDKFIGQNLTDYQSICKYISGLNKTQYSQCFQQFANQHDNQGNRYLSGIDVQQTCDRNDKSAACTYRYKADQNQVIYKYRGEQIRVPEYRQGWKDVTIIPEIAYTRLRIRWTRNDFPQKQTVQNQRQRQLFFYASQEQLGEFPGYTYRSTQVIDQQSHMIRPIMVRPHSQGSSKTWKQIYDRINKAMFSNYKQRVYTSWYADDSL